MVLTAAMRPTRQNSRRMALLDAAAHLFRARGFEGTSVRDIAAAAGLTPAAIYSHFASKDDLLLAVYAEGVGRIAARVDAAAARESNPRGRLAAACEAHLETLLDRGDYARVVIRVLPQDVPSRTAALVALRDGYEARFTRLLDALVPLSASERHYLRLLLMGAMNWAQNWYRPDGDPPRVIARRFLDLLTGVIEGTNDAA